MSGYLIKDTTKEERIALIRSWQEPDDCVEGSGIDLFDMYDAYIKGEKEISQINAEFQASYIKSEESMERPEEEYSSTSGEIMKLKQMLDDGILTEDEFTVSLSFFPEPEEKANPTIRIFALANAFLQQINNCLVGRIFKKKVKVVCSKKIQLLFMVIRCGGRKVKADQIV